jgi:hypothetical protein
MEATMDSMHQPRTPPESPPWQMRLMMMSYMVPRCLFAAAKLDIATSLAAGPKTTNELAKQTGAHGPTLHRILRALASAGVFRETTASRFENTALSDTLRSDVQGSLRPWVLMHGDEMSWSSWGEFDHSVMTGTSAFEHLNGETIFDYFPRYPERAAIFDQAMSAVTQMASAPIVGAYDFSGIETLVDVGGGNATMLCAILESNPKLHGIVFDLPHVKTAATEYIESRQLQDRCAFVGGSFFDSPPPRADAYFLQRVLHDWDDENSIRILRACANAAGSPAKVLISEAIIPPGNDPFYGKLIDLHMLVMTHGGKERTQEEYGELLSASGWTCQRTVPTGSPFSLVEGVKS